MQYFCEYEQEIPPRYLFGCGGKIVRSVRKGLGRDSGRGGFRLARLFIVPSSYLSSTYLPVDRESYPSYYL
jgi:hypothetical protein